MAERRGLMTQSVAEQVLNMGEKQGDARFYNPTPDQNGNVGVIVRILPSPDPLHPVFVLQRKYHDIRLNGQKFVEKCPQTLKVMYPEMNTYCPVCDEGSRLWAAGDKDRGKAHFAKTKYIANIVVLDDPMTPTNNGKVFLFEFTKTLYDVINSAIKPQTQIQKPVFVYDYEKGANLNLIGLTDSFPSPNDGKSVKFVNYEKSKFDAPSALPEDFIDYVDAQLYNLSELVDKETYLSAEDLKEKYDKTFLSSASFVTGGIPVPAGNNFYVPTTPVDRSEGFIPSPGFKTGTSSAIVVPAPTPNAGMSFLNRLEESTKQAAPVTPAAPAYTIPSAPVTPQISPVVPQTPVAPTATAAPAVSTDAVSFMERLKQSIASK